MKEWLCKWIKSIREQKDREEKVQEKSFKNQITLTDVKDWEGGRLPVAFGLVVVG